MSEAKEPTKKPRPKGKQTLMSDEVRMLRKAKKEFAYFCDVMFLTSCGFDTGMTPLQKEFAKQLQYDKDDRIFFSLFRGAGKSLILSLYCVWLLWRDGDEKIIVVSASSAKANDFVSFTRKIILDTPFLTHLLPKGKKEAASFRSTANTFDVMTSTPSQFPSITAKGITSQITGSRGSLVIFDDAETLSNSQTEGARAKILKAIREANALLIPERDSKIRIIGTPQSKHSVYHQLDGFRRYFAPIIFPKASSEYEELMPYLAKRLEKNPNNAGKCVEPKRFTDADVNRRKRSYGDSEFALQYLLKTDESDAMLYPLRTKDLRLMPIGDAHKFYVDKKDQGPLNVRGQTFIQAAPNNPLMLPFEKTIAAVDIASTGRDTHCIVVASLLGANIYVRDIYTRDNGFEGLEDQVLFLNKWGVSTTIAETNHSGNGWIELMQRTSKDMGMRGLAIEPVHSHGKKSLRIVQTVEPFLASGRLVMDFALAERILSNPKDNLFSQMESITRENIDSNHDDVIDALSLLLQQCKNVLQKSSNDVIKDYEEKVLDIHLESIIKAPEMMMNIGNPKARRRTGVRGNWLNGGRRRRF